MHQLRLGCPFVLAHGVEMVVVVVVLVLLVLLVLLGLVLLGLVLLGLVLLGGGGGGAILCFKA